jgi:hypothetical protein
LSFVPSSALHPPAHISRRNDFEMQRYAEIGLFTELSRIIRQDLGKLGMAEGHISGLVAFQFAVWANAAIQQEV